MKGAIRKITLFLLAVTAAVCAALGIAACGDGGDGITGLKVENAKISFLVGDEFDLGAYRVYALNKDGTQTDVTSLAELKPETGFDMNTAGDYQIRVSYGGKYEIINIYVNQFEPVLTKIALNSENVKKQYELGESVSFDGLLITTTHKNAQGVDIVSTETSVKNFTITVTDENGDAVGQILNRLGSFTVTVSKGLIKDSYVVRAEGINISTVQSALIVGSFYKSEVVTGRQIYQTALRSSNYVFNDAFDYTYEYGKANYTFISESIETKSQNHYSMDEEGLFHVMLQNGKIVNGGITEEEMINGPRTMLWYADDIAYGIESVLQNLYEHAQTCTNRDLVETADEVRREYSFKFSTLKMRTSNSDFFETEVKFTLGEKYNIERAEISQSYYENNYSLQDSQGADFVPSFITDKNGITTPNVNPPHKMHMTVEQTAGERTAENPYNRQMFKINSYDLVYGDKTLSDNDTIKCHVDDGKLTISIKNILPLTADVSNDTIYFRTDKPYDTDKDSVLMAECDGFYAWRTASNDIVVTLRNGGIYKLIITTSNTQKTITFDITGKDPLLMTSQIYNEASGAFYAGGEKTVPSGGHAYFYGAVAKFANSAQTFTVTSDNAELVSVTEAEINGIKCFKFEASQEGTYTVKVVSAVNESAYCTFTFTVSDVPDYANLLSGEYTVTDRVGNIFKVVFTPSGAGSLNGTVTVTKTPTTADDVPETDKAVTETLSYTASAEDMQITVIHVSGANLGVSFTTDENASLVLVDQYDDEYKLNR